MYVCINSRSHGCFSELYQVLLAIVLWLLFRICGCTERKISPDPTSWKTNNEELIRRLQKGNQETHLIIQNLVTKVDILERKVLELELERSKTENIIEKQDKRLQFLGSLSPRQTNLDNPEEPVLYDERRSNSFVTVGGPTLQTAEPIVFTVTCLVTVCQT